MKQTLLFLTVMFSVSASFAQLTGTYTIYGTAPDYATIQAACTDLHAQGQSGAVIFNIRDGNHVEAVTLDTVAGNSSTNSITFQSENADSTLVNISSTAGNTFTFNSVDFVHFNNIGLTYSGPSGSRVVLFNNSGNGSSFDNTAIFCSPLNGGYAIYADRDEGVNDFSFLNSTIDCYNGGLYLRSGITNVNNFTMDNSTINSVNTTGLEIYAEKFANNAKMTDSDISTDNGYGFRIEGYYGSVNDLSITNSSLHSTNSRAFYGYSDLKMDNGTIDNSTFTSDNSNAYYMEGYSGSVSNWMVKNSVFTAFQDAFYAYSDQTLSNMTFMNDSMISNPLGTCCANGNALEIEGNSVTQNIDIHDNYFYTDSANYGGRAIDMEAGNGIMTDIKCYDNVIKSEYGIDFESEGPGTNWWINNNDISTRYDGIELEADYGSGINFVITNNYIETGIGSGLYIYSDAAIVDCRVDSNTIDSYYDAMYIEGYEGGMNNINIQSNLISSTQGEGMYLYTDALMQNVEVKYNSITADDEGIYIEGYDGGLNNISVYENDIDAGQEGIYIESDAATQNISIKQNTVSAYYEGISVDSDYGGMDEVLIDSNYAYSAIDNGINVYAYGSVNNVTITNNEAYGDTVNCCESAIYVESYYTSMDNLIISDNEASAYYYGIYIEADAGNATNALVTNNKVWAGNYGIYFEGAGSGSEISFNNIEPNISYGTQLYSGIYTDGDGGPNTGLKISNNFIANVESYGIEAYTYNNLVIENNEIISTEANDDLYGIYTEYIGGTDSRINANKILTNGESEGIYLRSSSFSADNPMVISNNFLTGFAYAIELDDVSYVNLIHNSVSSANTSQVVYLTGVTNTNILNNIFKNSNTSGQIYYGSSNSSIMIDYNAYDYDETVATMSNDSYFGINTTLADFQSNFGMSANAILANPMFLNDTLDLHIPCGNTALSVGTVTDVIVDVDGFARNLTSPTIGAHEIAPATADFLPDSINLCFPASLVSGATGTHLWSTGETTQVITVSGAGTFYCTVTDACGNTSSDTVVVYTDTPVASFVWGLNDTQGLFNNTSTGGTSYAWDFGDQTTSTDENPVHYFPWGYGSYTVLLTVTNECGGIDTMSQLVTILSLDVDEADAQALEFNLYPNPSTGFVTIEASESIGEISIYDLSGKLVYFQNNSDSQLQIDLSHLTKGMYIVKIATAEATVNRRMILK